MSSPGNSSSPTYKHLKYKLKQSPVELKELMRKVSFCCTYIFFLYTRFIVLCFSIAIIIRPAKGYSDNALFYRFVSFKNIVFSMRNHALMLEMCHLAGKQ